MSKHLQEPAGNVLLYRILFSRQNIHPAKETGEISTILLNIQIIITTTERAASYYMNSLRQPVEATRFNRFGTIVSFK